MKAKIPYVLMALIVALSVLIIQFGGRARADEFEVKLKQGIIATWGDWEIKHIALVELAKTKPKEEWKKWNILWDGWSVDVGYPFDNPSNKDVGILLGREVGTIGKYLPINFPFKDKLVITIHPSGVYAKELLDFRQLKLKGASGASYIKGTIRF